jgi:homoserine dehydrogenase
MQTFKLFFLGFGTVGRALLRLLAEKQSFLRETYDVSFPAAAVATRRHGMALDPGGLDPAGLLQRSDAGGRIGERNFDALHLKRLLAESGADILIELTPTDRENGEPAISHIRAALDSRVHAVTANKGPVAFAYHTLRDQARKAERRFLFESVVMDGTPVFSLQREALPAARILGFRGILNSTTNYLIARMAEGMDFEEAVGAAQAVGIAETDPLADVDGWDAAFKVAALVNVWWGAALEPSAVKRQGIGKLAPADIRRARSEGRPYKLVCRAERTERGVAASVGPEQVDADDPLAAVGGTGTMLILKTDTLPGVIIGGSEPSPATTAYGLLSDLLCIARSGGVSLPRMSAPEK